MENKNISKFQFENFKIIKSYFEMGEEQDNYAFSINFSPKGILDKENSKFELELGILIEEEKNKFKVDFTALGIFSFETGLDSEVLNKYFYVNAPAIIFPYVRAYISALTSLSGLKTITIPTLNLSNVGKELEKNTIIR